MTLYYRLAGVVALCLAPQLAEASGEGDDDEIVVIEDGDEDLMPSSSSSSSAASQIFFTGEYQSRAALDLMWEGHGEDIFALRNRLELQLIYEPDPSLKVTVGGCVTHRLLVEAAREPGDQRAELHRAWVEPELREAYLLWRLDFGMDLTVGQRIFTWGQTDFTQPLNVLNPSDFRDGPTSARRTPLIPVFSVEAAQRIGPAVAEHGGRRAVASGLGTRHLFRLPPRHRHDSRRSTGQPSAHGSG